MKYGYLRVSTPLQSFDQQERALRTHGVRIFEKETVSGRNKARPVLEALLEELRRDDELHVIKLDRLGRDARELREIADLLQARGVALVVDGTRYDPADPMGKMFFGILALFAEFEADLIADRTRERLATLRAQGKHVGRKRKLTERQEIAIYNAVKGNAATLKELAERYSVGMTTIRRAIEHEELKRKFKTDPELRRELRAMKANEEELLAALDKADREAQAQREKEAAS